MIKKVFALLVFIVCYSNNAFSQQTETITYLGKTLNVPEPLKTNERFFKFEYNMAEARKAFLAKDYERTVYYVKTAERDGIHSSAFWFYLAISKLNLGDEGAGKKYLKIGFVEQGCWECGEAFEKIFGEKLKY